MMNKQFYGVYKENEQYVLSLTTLHSDGRGDINPHTGIRTNFTGETINTYDSEKKAMQECRRLNILLV